MARNACLAIGISDAPPLNYLPGAVNGARAIGEWAGRLGYVTEVLTDEARPVGTAEVDAALRRLLPKNEKTDRLIVSFAGHGLTRGAFEDLWLLSQWFELQRAVSIEGLRARLARFGVGQVALISDACRSLPADADTAELVADSVLGRGPFDLSKPSVDILKASTKYRAAYMIPGEREEDDRCLFTGVLEEALWGLHPGAEDGFRPGPPKCITSASLARFLRSEVPLKAQTYKIELDPDIQPGFLQPDDVYVSLPVADPPAPKAWPAAVATAAMGVGPAAPARTKRGWSTVTAPAEKVTGSDRSKANIGSGDGGGGGGRYGRSDGYGGGTRGGWRSDFGFEAQADRGHEPPAPPEPLPTLTEFAEEERKRVETERAAKTARKDEILSDYRHERPPRHFETEAGVSVTGAAVEAVHLGPLGKASFDQGHEEAGDAGRPGWQVRSVGRGALEESLPLLVELKSGRWAGAAAIPGYVVRLGFERPPGRRRERAESLIFSRTGRRNGSNVAEQALAELRAGIVNRRAAVDYAIMLRLGKHDDPVLGVLAAYMYYAIGDIGSVRQIAFYYARSQQPIPYDIALLAEVGVSGHSGQLVAHIPPVPAHRPDTEQESKYAWAFEATDEAEGKIAGSFPWLRQGWALLEAAEAPLVPEGLTKIARGLIPGTFTTLRPTAGKQLLKLIGGDPK